MAVGAGAGFVLAALVFPAVLALSQARHSTRFALSIAAMSLVGWWFSYNVGQVLHRERTFFGTYQVRLDATQRHRMLVNGTTLHGMQAVVAPDRAEPLTYFHKTGPFGQMFTILPQLSRVSEVAVVGLGIGSLASYSAPAQHWTFYEIDPAEERIARNRSFFTYLHDCGNRCGVVLGDARLSLVQARPNVYGLLVLDAFSSDAIPVHLLTSEALSLYLSRLAPSGVIAFHISNRHLSLAPIVGRLADAHGLFALEQRERLPHRPQPEGKTESHWVVMARDRSILEPLVGDRRWKRLVATPRTSLWTDDFSNVLAALTFR
jgi:hypothetical protein